MSSQNKIIMFVKVFEKNEYLKDFMNGKLFMNRLSYFQKVEDNFKCNRSDRHEGIRSWLQPDRIMIKIGTLDISGNELAAPIMIQMNAHKHYNVFCLYAGHTGEFEELTSENASEFLEKIKINDECLNLGDFCVVIHNPKLFLERITSAIKKTGYSGAAKLVEYYDPDDFHGDFDEQDVVFKKRKEYSYQSEYRIYIDTELEGDEPYVLQVGDLRDIAVSCKTCEINSMLSINNSHNNKTF